MQNKIIESYREIFATYTEFEGSILEKHISKLKELDQYLPHNSTFFSITNTTSRSFEYVSKNFAHCFALDINKLCAEGMTYWWSRMHPDEMNSWLASLNELMVFTLANFSLEQRKQMSYTWNYRIRDVNDAYKNVIQHTTPMYFDNEGKPIIGLAHYSVLAADYILPIQATAKLLNKKGEYETVYHQAFGRQRQLGSHSISHRERDILRLLSFGYSNEDIADKLNISRNTVKTHRRNILNKTNTRNTTELVARCIREGLI